MSVKALEELRGLRDEAARKMVDNPKWVCKRAEEIADNIEAEIAERFMERPCDADGVPIHMGDSVEGELLFDNATVRGTVCAYHIHDDDEQPGTVYIRVKPTEDTWTIKELQFRRCRHAEPCTLESVLADFAESVRSNGFGSCVERYADEIRELLGAHER